MKRGILLVLFTLVAQTSVSGAPCDIACEEVSRFKTYLSWQKSWWNRNYLDESQLVFRTIKGHDRVLWYLASKETLFIQDTVGRLDWISKIGCKVQDGVWQKCVEDYLVENDQKDITSLLLGTPDGRQVGILTNESICELIIVASTVVPWEPSPDSPQKRKMAAAIRNKVEETLEGSSDANGISSLVCNDFNINDPHVYVLVRYADSDMLILLAINGRRSIAGIVRFDIGNRIPIRIKSRILAQPILLD